MVATRDKEQKKSKTSRTDAVPKVPKADGSGQKKRVKTETISKERKSAVKDSIVNSEIQVDGSDQGAIGLQGEEQVAGSEIGIQESRANGSTLGLGKRKHKRLDDDDDDDDQLKADAEIAELKLHPKEPEDIATKEDGAQEGSNMESDDEAPEEVTVATGEAQAKAAAAVKAKAMKKQADERKAKRKKRDRELKEQAKASKKRKLSTTQDQHDDSSDTSSPSKPETSTHKSVHDLAKSLLESEGPLPAYLPDEIFAMEPEPRPAVPLTARPKEPKPQDTGQEERIKRKRLDVQTKPVKDVQRGNTRVRVLPQQSLALPPPVVKSSARIREQWLKDGMKRVKVPGYRQTGARSFLRR